MANFKKCAHCGVSDTIKADLKEINNKFVHEHCYEDFKLRLYLRSLKKCDHCDIKDTPKNELLTFDEEFPTRTVTKYLHANCYDDYVFLSNQKKTDRLDLVDLDSTLKRIFNVTILPNQIFVKLANVRSGGGTGYQDIGSGKNGYSYAELNDGFLKCEGEIDYAMSYKRFHNFSNMFAYCLEIVVSYLVKNEADKALTEHSQTIAEGIMSGHLVDDFEDDGLADFKKDVPNKQNKKSIFYDDL